MKHSIRAGWVIALKEWTELRRQPGVLVLVVLGPFLVLAAFGLGYRNEELALRTIFVGPADSAYEESIERYAGSIEDYVVPLAFTQDFLAAIEDLREERADVVIVLPPDPAEAVAAGEQSEIAVIHNSIDPIEAIGIEFATEVAVRELNATIVTATLDGLLAGLAELDRSAVELNPLIDDLDQAIQSGDEARIVSSATSLRVGIERVRPVLDVFDSLEGTSAGSEKSESDENDQNSEPGSIDELIVRLDDIAMRTGAADSDLAVLRADLDELSRRADLVLSLDARVLARPFFGDAESLVRQRIRAEHYVAPGATALLLQHLGVVLAALSFVRDERRGILTNYQVGPTSVGSVLVGKLTALSGVVFLAGLAVVFGQVFLVGVPQFGSAPLLVLGIAALSAASVAIGLLLAAISRNELQALQLSMITLLVGLFFSGFLLDLDRIRQPVAWIGMLVPATPAVELMRTVQLRGSRPALGSFALFGLHAALGVGIATLSLRRRWRIT
ncbi:MAG: ABC transporter permease [Acidimicrobiales bacterium]|nr:ABC transporter permease [Acidimicrobiales bacterium]